MAIDNAAKRASAMGYAKPYLTLVPPDATIAQADRQTNSNRYGGILADPEEPYVSEGDSWRQGRRHASFNALHGGDMRTYNEDMIAGCLANDPTITSTTATGILFEWLDNLGYSQTTLQGKMNAFAVARGHHNWTSMGTFTVS